MSAAPPISIRPPTYAAGYAVRDVARLTGLAVPQILGFVRAGTVAPRRGPRREYRFSFQDLVVLRTARDLLAKVSPRKLHRALRRLRERLPNGRQLATVRIAWEGDELVVRTSGFKDDLWLDASGNPLSGTGKLTERIRRPNFGTLEVEMTIDDSTSYLAPWTVTLRQPLVLDSELLDYYCLENEKSLAHMIKK